MENIRITLEKETRCELEKMLARAENLSPMGNTFQITLLLINKNLCDCLD